MKHSLYVLGALIASLVGLSACGQNFGISSEGGVTASCDRFSNCGEETTGPLPPPTAVSQSVSDDCNDLALKLPEGELTETDLPPLLICPALTDATLGRENACVCPYLYKYNWGQQGDDPSENVGFCSHWSAAQAQNWQHEKEIRARYDSYLQCLLTKTKAVNLQIFSLPFGDKADAVARAAQLHDLELQKGDLGFRINRLYSIMDTEAHLKYGAPLYKFHYQGKWNAKNMIAYYNDLSNIPSKTQQSARAVYLPPFSPILSFSIFIGPYYDE